MSKGQEIIRGKRGEILEVAARYGARDVRVFGSTARGQDGPDSDFDILVRFDQGRTLLDHAGLEIDLEELLGRPVEVASERGLREEYRDHVLNEAVRV